MTVVGEAFVEVSPKVTGFAGELEAGAKSALTDARPGLAKVADDLGMAIGDGLIDGLRGMEPRIDGLFTDSAGRLRNARGQYAKAGDVVGGAAGEGIQTGIRSESGEIERAGQAAGRDLTEGVRRGVGGIKSVILGAAGAFAAFGAGQVIKEAVSQAGDLGESVNAIRVVLGPAADDFLKFGEGAADSLGLTQAALNEALIPTAAIFKNAGLGGDALSSSMEQLAQRATDVGSVFNRDTTEVLESFGAALRGEAEPARQFGVSLNESALAAKAVELGLIGVGDAMTEQAKTQAAFALIMEQTNVAAGDFANTADSLPNTLKRLQASAKEALGAIGGPLLNPLASVGADLMASLGPIEGVFGEIGDALGVAVSGLAEPIGSIVTALGPILTAIAPVVGQLAESFGGVLANVLEALGPAFEALAPFITQVISLMGDGLTDVIETLAPALVTLAPVVARIATLFGEAFVGAITALAPVIVGLVEGIAPLISVFADALAPVLDLVAPLLADIGKQLGDVFADLGPTLAPLLKQMADELAPLLPELVTSFSDLVVALLPIIPALVQLLPPLIRFAGFITGAQLRLFTLLIDAVTFLVKPLVSLTSAVAGLLAGGLTDLFDWIGSLSMDELVDQFGAGLDAIGEFFATLPGIVGDGIGVAVEFVQGLPGKAAEALASLGSTLAEKAAAGLVIMAGAFRQGAIDALTFIVTMPARGALALAEFGPKIAGAIVSGWLTANAKVREGIVEAIGFLLGMPQRAFDALTEFGPKLAGALVAGMAAGAGAVKTGVTNIATELLKLPGKVLGLGQSLLDAGISIGGKIFDGIKSAIGAVAGFAGDLAGSIADALADIMRDLVQKLNDAIPNRLGKGALSIDIPDNPIPNPFSLGGITTEDRIDGNGSRLRELVVPLDRGQALIDKNLALAGLTSFSGAPAPVGSASGGNVFQFIFPSVTTEAEARKVQGAIDPTFFETLIRASSAGAGEAA